jgi:hypothetical protein
MRDILKELNDRNPCDVRALDERGLQRFEVLCEAWARIAEAAAAGRDTARHAATRLVASIVHP